MYTSVLVFVVILAHFSRGNIALDITFEDISNSFNIDNSILLPSEVMATTTMRTEMENPPEQTKKCGVSKVFTITPLIINGKEATVGTFPWHAGLYYRTFQNKKEYWEQKCGGSLITDRFILTAANCVEGKNKLHLRVALRKYFRSWDHYENSEQKRNVSEITYPKNFKRRTNYFDIALLLLDEKVKLGEVIMPVCTGFIGDPIYLLKKSLFAVGWGKTTTRKRSETLLYSDDSGIVPREVCQMIINQLGYSLFEKICISSRKNPDLAPAQAGDTGSGMTVEHGGVHYILGIVSVVLENVDLITNLTWGGHTSWIQTEVGKYDAKFSWTGNDEPTKHSSRLCELPDASPTRKFCRLTAGCQDCNIYTTRCHVPPGSSADQVKVVCAPGYTIETSNIAVCVDGEWQPEISRCLKLCPPLASETLLLKCRYGNDPVPCSDLALPGTIVSFECQTSFSDDSGSNRQGVYRNIITCLRSGEWSGNLTSCTAGCGVSKEVKKLSPTIVNGQNANIGFFPWHAGLYYRGPTSWDQICGGSLITDRVVLTAAHCLKDVTDVNQLRVALGKYYRSWDTIEPTEEKRNVSEIALPSEFNPNILTFDIALVLLSERITLGEYIMPVCLDYGEGTDYLQNSKLYVVGWGKTSSTIQAQPSDNLLNNTVRVMSQNDCERTLPHFYSTFEKLCGVKYNSESITQLGDSGGGLTAVYQDGLHYIVGVISGKVNQTTLFTHVKYKTHIEWINFKVREFSAK